MSAREIIEEIKNLAPDERAEVARFFDSAHDNWIPDSFKKGMDDAEAGRLVEMEAALGEEPPARLR